MSGMAEMTQRVTTGNIRIICDDDDAANDARVSKDDEKTENRDSALPDSLSPPTGNIHIISDDDSIEDTAIKHGRNTDNRDSALPESLPTQDLRDEMCTGIDYQSPDRLTDTMYGVPSFSADIIPAPTEAEVIRQSDELTSFTFGLDAKEESIDGRVCSINQSDGDSQPHSITNILASLSLTEHRDKEDDVPDASLTGSRLPIDNILGQNLHQRVKSEIKAGKSDDDGTKRVQKYDATSEKDRHFDQDIIEQFALADDHKRITESILDSSIQTHDLATDTVDPKESGGREKVSDVQKDISVTANDSAAYKADVDDAKERRPPEQSEHDPATLSVRDKSAIFRRQPVSPPRSDKGPIKTTSSVRNRKSLFESAASNAEIESRPKPQKRLSLGHSASFRTSLQMAEDSSSGKAEVESRPKPQKRLSLDQSASFRTSLQMAEVSSSGKAEVESMPKPQKRLSLDQSASFRTSLQMAEVSSSGKVDVQLRPKSQERQGSARNAAFRASLQIAEKSSTGQIGYQAGCDQEPAARPKIISNPSFRAARQLAEKGRTISFGGVKQKSEDVTNVIDRNEIPKTDTPSVIRDSIKTVKDNTMVVAAIDFGTTYSAIGFSFKNDPERIVCKTWEGQIKTPTVLLLDPNKNIDSFGDEAKRRFVEMFDEHNTYRDWFYFDCFKMKLYVTDQYLDKNIKLLDYSGKEMEAMDVFAKALSYMRGELVALLNEERRGVIIKPDSDIHWVLTVPAIWPDLSKTFMREAAQKAKIPTDYLTLALEPEAASLYCRRQMGVDLREKTYLVLDLGGGTADFVCHEVQHNDSIKECYMATGGDFGGKMIDDEFMKLLTSLYGAEVMKEFRKTKQYLDFCISFELKKRKFDGNRDWLFNIPVTLNEIFERKIGQSIELAIQQSPLLGKIKWTRGSTWIDKELMKDIFDKPLKRILDTIAQVMNEVDNIDHLVMVGGFSNSKYIVQGIEHRYPEEGFVLTPEDPSVAVVMGAVRFGHETKAIVSRVSKYTYGIGRMMTFKPGDREDYKFRSNGTYWCDNCFNKHIEIGEEISTEDESEVQAHEYYPPNGSDRCYFLEVIASRNNNPRYTTDSDCYSIGGIKIEIDQQGDVWSKIEVKLVFKGTELEVQAFDVKNRKLTTGRVDFWG